MSVETELAPLGDELATWLAGRRFGAVQVVRVDSAVIVDVDGYPAIDLAVTLRDPVGETWPADEIQQLRRSVRLEAQKHSDAPFVYLSLRPETDDEPDTDADESER